MARAHDDHFEHEHHGRKVKARLRGDERRHQLWVEDGEEFEVEDTDSPILAKLVRPIQRAPAFAGTIRNLVICVKFKDHEGRELPNQGVLQWFFNAVNGYRMAAPTGSVYDYFKAQSYGAALVESTVCNWIQVPYTEKEAINRLDEVAGYALSMAEEALELASFDQNGDGVIDNLTIVHSGYCASFGGSDSDGKYFTDRLWSHAAAWDLWTGKSGLKAREHCLLPAFWGRSGGQMIRLGQAVHELGHLLFNLPDQYKEGADLGYWCSMAHAAGWRRDHFYPGSLCPWCKIKAGWADKHFLLGPETYTIAPSALKPDIRAVVNLLLEHRATGGFDTGLAAPTLAMFHVIADIPIKVYTDSYEWVGGTVKKTGLTTAGLTFSYTVPAVTSPQPTPEIEVLRNKVEALKEHLAEILVGVDQVELVLRLSNNVSKGLAALQELQKQLHEGE